MNLFLTVYTSNLQIFPYFDLIFIRAICLGIPSHIHDSMIRWVLYYGLRTFRVFSSCPLNLWRSLETTASILMNYHHSFSIISGPWGELQKTKIIWLFFRLISNIFLKQIFGTLDPRMCMQPWKIRPVSWGFPFFFFCIWDQNSSQNLHSQLHNT